VKSWTSTRTAFTATGVLAGATLCLVLAGPANAASPTPSSTTAPSASTAPLPTATPSLPASTAPAGPIDVPAGNAKTAPQSSDVTALSLLGAGGVLIAGAGVFAARRRT